jgi:hypothetical protein
MATTSGPIYELLVANFSRPNPAPGYGADPVVTRPTKIRSGFIFRHVQNIGLSTELTNATRAPARSVITKTLNAQMQPFAPNQLPFADVEVISDVFSGQSASLFVGPYELVSNRDFVTGGGLVATALNISNAINNLPGYSAVPAGAVVTVTGPGGQIALRFDAEYRGGERNFDFTYPDSTQDGYLGFDPGFDPEEPPTIIPPAPLQGAPPP